MRANLSWIAAKILSLEALQPLVKEMKQQGRKVVLANGCFDWLHVGHVRYLREARQLGDCLVVAVNADASVLGPQRAAPSPDARAGTGGNPGCPGLRGLRAGL